MRWVVALPIFLIAGIYFTAVQGIIECDLKDLSACSKTQKKTPVQYYAFRAPAANKAIEATDSWLLKWGLTVVPKTKLNPYKPAEAFVDRYRDDILRVASTCLEENGYVTVNSDPTTFAPPDPTVLTDGNTQQTMKDCVKSHIELLGSILCESSERCMDLRFACSIEHDSSLSISPWPAQRLTSRDHGYQITYTDMRTRVKFQAKGQTEWAVYSGTQTPTAIVDVLDKIFRQDLIVGKEYANTNTNYVFLHNSLTLLNM